jgi:hypothetical protein
MVVIFGTHLVLMCLVKRMLLSVGDTSWLTLYVERDLQSKDCFEPVAGTPKFDGGV